jgi:hypothetical protein
VDGSTALVLVFAFYFSFRALSLRRALVDPPYRDRALWTAMGGLSAVLFVATIYVDAVFGEVATTSQGVIAEAAIWGAALLVLLGWLETNINVAISADYFNRDALGWKRGGWVVLLAVFLVGYSLASLPQWWLPQALTASALGDVLISVAFFLATGYAALVLALTYFRIRDLRIKTYTKWVALSLVSLFAYVVFPNLDTGLPSVIVVIPALAWIYCMNGTVSALAIRTRTLTQSEP